MAPSLASAVDGKMPPGPSAEEGGRDGGCTGYDLRCANGAFHVEPWKVAFAHDPWGRIGMKLIPDTSQTPYQALHVQAPVALYRIIFVQHQCGDLICVENKIFSVKATFMKLGITM